MDSDDVSVSSGAAPPGTKTAKSATTATTTPPTPPAAAAAPSPVISATLITPSLSRSMSQQSAASSRSHRSGRGYGHSNNNGRRGSSRVPPGQQQSTSSSSVSVTSDDTKSLISFPSLSPETEAAAATTMLPPPAPTSAPTPPTATAAAPAPQRASSRPPRLLGAAASLLDGPPTTTTTTTTPPISATTPSTTTASTSTITVPATTTTTTAASSLASRNDLFGDAPLPSSKVIPGALHLTDDAHIARLIGKHGAVGLVRQLAEDLAVRDAQIAALRVRAAQRERFLRKIILECGLSSLDLETRLRALEQEYAARAQQQAAEHPENPDAVTSPSAPPLSNRVSDLMSDAMADDNSFRTTGSGGSGGGGGDDYFYSGATIRATMNGSSNNANKSAATNNNSGTVKGWKDFLWGGSTKRSSRASSVSNDAGAATAASSSSNLPGQDGGANANGNGNGNGNPLPQQRATAVRLPLASDRRPTISDDLFEPPPSSSQSESTPFQKPPPPSTQSSRPASVKSGTQSIRKGSLASMALRLVVGGNSNGSNSNNSKDNDTPPAKAVTANNAPSNSTRSVSASKASGKPAPKPGTGTVRSSRAATIAQGTTSRALLSMRKSASTMAIPQMIPGGSNGSGGSGSGHAGATSVRGQAQERWGEMMESLPSADGFPRTEAYVPVEMDTILPPEVQPPTLTHMYNRYNSSQYLIDRFGFIYDQRRKKREREAAQVARHMKHRRRPSEMLNSGLSGRSTPSMLIGPTEEDEDSRDSKSVQETDQMSISSSLRSSRSKSQDAGSNSSLKGSDGVPDSPATGSFDEAAQNSASIATAATVGDAKENQPKRWQDYLKIATFPTELLSHTPAMSDLRIQVIADGEDTPSEGAASGTGGGSGSGTGSGGTGGGGGSGIGPKSPGFITADGRGVLPSTGALAAAATSAVTTSTTGLDSDSIASTDSKQAQPAPLGLPTPPTLHPPQQQQQQQLKKTDTVRTEEEGIGSDPVKEDVEPVRLLLHQLSDLHDKLQKERMVRWSEFMRKVRAERRREGEVAAATAAAAAEARFLKATAVMPETRLADGEMIGVAGLGNKGKLGRAKWNEFRTLVLGGIPVVLRAKVWAECTGANSLRIPGAYEDLVAGRETEGAAILPRSEESEDKNQDRARADADEVVTQIQADIYRTLTDNIFFREGPGTTKLNEVLLAYARRNPEVGYCQGMNLIAANLLLVTPSAEDAFWLLASIIETILPTGYYDHSLLASRADQQVLRGYVAEVLPRLSAHFDALSIDLETMTFQWFLSVFTDCLSAEALFRVWDVVLCLNEGSVFLFQVALALLKLNETALLLRCDTPAAVYTYINHQMTNHAISIDGLIQASEALRKLVRRDDVEARRARAIAAEKALVEARAAAVQEAAEARRKREDERKAKAAARQRWQKEAKWKEREQPKRYRSRLQP